MSLPYYGVNIENENKSLPEIPTNIKFLTSLCYCHVNNYRNKKYSSYEYIGVLMDKMKKGNRSANFYYKFLQTLNFV
jgi:hypothetical protein